jgi:hypothetical protein
LTIMGITKEKLSKLLDLSWISEFEPEQLPDLLTAIELKVR